MGRKRRTTDHPVLTTITEIAKAIGALAVAAEMIRRLFS
jgi:hypothetical protein